MSGSKDRAVSKAGKASEVQGQHYIEVMEKPLQRDNIWVVLGDLRLGLLWDYEQWIDYQDVEPIWWGTA